MRILLGLSVCCIVMMMYSASEMNGEIYGGADCNAPYGDHLCSGPPGCALLSVKQTTTNPAPPFDENRIVIHDPTQGGNCNLLPTNGPPFCDAWEEQTGAGGCTWNMPNPF